MILVAGATGRLGGEICRRLRGQDKVVRGLVRASSNAERVENLHAMGVETVIGDLRDPASLSLACQGVETVITTVTTTASQQPGDSIPATDQQGGLNLVKAASEAGVKHFIYVSYSINIEKGLSPQSPLTVAKRTVEQAVIQSGMLYTILRPADFMEIWLSPQIGFDYPNTKANILGDGNARISYISLSDVAQYAVESVGNPNAHNQIFELGGPAALSPLEVVRIFEWHCGRAFALQFIPAAVLRAQRETATDPLQLSFASLMLAQTNGDDVDNDLARKVFHFPLTSVDSYAQQVLK